MANETRSPPGAQPTHCATCPISSGCSWGCLRGDDLAEIARLRNLLAVVATALPVLRRVCDRAGLDLGAHKAGEMETWVQEFFNEAAGRSDLNALLK